MFIQLNWSILVYKHNTHYSQCVVNCKLNTRILIAYLNRFAEVFIFEKITIFKRGWQAAKPRNHQIPLPNTEVHQIVWTKARGIKNLINLAKRHEVTFLNSFRVLFSNMISTCVLLTSKLILVFQQVQDGRYIIKWKDHHVHFITTFYLFL